jgi:hypothetical protein
VRNRKLPIAFALPLEVPGCVLRCFGGRAGPFALYRRELDGVKFVPFGWMVNGIEAAKNLRGTQLFGEELVGDAPRRCRGKDRPLFRPSPFGSEVRIDVHADLRHSQVRYVEKDEVEECRRNLARFVDRELGGQAQAIACLVLEDK